VKGRLAPVLTCATALSLVGSIDAAQGRSAGELLRLQVGGRTREALVFAPMAKAANGLVPVILAFHGHGGSMRTAATGMHFQTAWPEAVVVYAQGLPIKTDIDPQGREPGWDSTETSPLGADNRDLPFVDALLTRLHADYHVDDARIYAAGFSNGAFFSLMIWAARGQTFAAFGIVAGGIRDWMPPIGRPVIYIGGEKDPLVKPDVQHDTIEKIRKFDGATANGEACGAGCTLYRSTATTPVRVVTHPGGHLFPPFATDAIVTFFKNHARMVVQ
jgi:polyhydroxybutyrate depolymerase